MADNYLLGMDCGTSNIKAVILRADGAIVGEASRPSRFIHPGPDMQEQDANEWWSNTIAIFRSLAEQVGTTVIKEIRGICISSHTVTMLPVDENGKPLRNAMTYQDNRSANELEQILGQIGKDNFVRIVGGQPAVAFLPSKLLWFKNHQPELFKKTASFLQASSYINYKLTGKMTMDVDQASRTQCLDMETLKWSKIIGDALGLELDRYLPEPRPVDEIIGFVTEEAAMEIGFIPGIPVLAGCSDAMASMYATGLSRLGEAGESSGTTSLVFIGSDKQSATDIPVVTRPCAIDGMPWVFDAPIQTSGAALKWFIERFAGEEQENCRTNGINIYEYLKERALEANPGSGGLLFFPYLLGERAPLWNSYARGMFIGLDMGLKREELIRSIFEGTAFALRHVVETIKESGGKVHALRICGGGSKSRTWSMVKASMLRCPVYLLSEKSGDVPVGDALMVGHKVGVFPDLTKAVETVVKVEEIIQPNEQWAEVYDRLYPYYVSLYQDLDQRLKSMREDVEEIKRYF